MSELNEQNKDNVTVDFHVNGMPLRIFKKFKDYAENYRGNYSITLQVLMEKVEFLNYLMAEEDLGITEVEEVETKVNNEIQTLGDE